MQTFFIIKKFPKNASVNISAAQFDVEISGESILMYPVADTMESADRICEQFLTSIVSDYI